MASQPRFSVVIPAFQAEATLGSALDSVLAQTRQDFEVVIVDDGSTDGTNQLARARASDPRVRLVEHPANQGLASARNTGIAESSAPYIGFLDADDLWMPRYLAEMGAALDADPGAGLAYTDGWTLDDLSRRILRATVMARQRPPLPPPHDAEEFLLELVKRNFIVAETMVRREAVAEVGGFDVKLRAVEDYELWLRMLAHGYRAVRPPGLLLIRRDRLDSMSKDPLLMYEAHRQVWQIVIDRHPASDAVKAVARRKVGEMERLIAAEADPSSSLPPKLRARLLAGRIKRRLLGDRVYLAEPPGEVQEAFELASV